jgi:hypothetical protein
MTLQLTSEEALRLAALPLRSLEREYPNAPSLLLKSPEDLRTPREIHPAFYGCFDWHSAVHGHWMLVRLLRQFEIPGARPILDRTLTPQNIVSECDFMRGRPGFERPYGLGWLLQLCAELYGWDDADGQRWATALRPLEELVTERFDDFLRVFSYPMRVGTHGNSAFAMGLALDYARTASNKRLEASIGERARRFYGADRTAPLAYEPSGNDFLSPSLIEADLMRGVLDADEFVTWFDMFMPDPSPLFSPAIVSDRSDGQVAHLDGLNLSRAWCMASIARALPDGHPWQVALEMAANDHAEAGLAAVASGHYEGEHWLASFAVYMLGRFTQAE